MDNEESKNEISPLFMTKEGGGEGGTQILNYIYKKARKMIRNIKKINLDEKSNFSFIHDTRMRGRGSTKWEERKYR